MEDKADPERDAKEFARGEVGEAAGSEEDANDRTNCRNRQVDGVSADHPLAMERNVAPANEQKARVSAKRKKMEKTVVAVAWLAPPMEGIARLMTRAEIPMRWRRSQKFARSSDARGGCGLL